MVGYARSLVEDVEFSCEDAGRSDPGLYEVIEAAIHAGATTINIPGVGYTTPSEFGTRRSPGSTSVLNVGRRDLCAWAQRPRTCGGQFPGSRQEPEPGNWSARSTASESGWQCLAEELVMALHVRRRYRFSQVRRRQSGPLDGGPHSRRSPRPQGWFQSHRHGGATEQGDRRRQCLRAESGIHQDGVLKNRLTYEIIDARTVGLSDNRIPGQAQWPQCRAGRLEELGYDLTREDLDEAFARFKDLADRKREITDRDLEAIVSEQIYCSSRKPASSSSWCR